MRLLTERAQVREVAKRWAGQYPNDRHGADKVEIRTALESLDPETATAEQVAKIIGNSSWAEPHKCGECNAKSWSVVQIGEEPGYESSTAYVCVDCLDAALRLARSAG